MTVATLLTQKYALHNILLFLFSQIDIKIPIEEIGFQASCIEWKTIQKCLARNC